MVEWSCNYGDGRLFRNVSIAELRDGQAPQSRITGVNPPPRPNGADQFTDRLDMPVDGIWKDAEHLDHH